MFYNLYSWLVINSGFLLRLALLLCGGIPFVIFASRALQRMLSKHFGNHYTALFVNGAYYCGFAFLIFSLLQECGFNLSAFLGAAGIMGIAVGFGAQTTISNAMSGLFLVFEQPFCVGDTIEVGSAKGVVYSIDLMSVKIRTEGNSLIRISHTDILKQPLINSTYFATRRVGIEIQIPFVTHLNCILEAIKKSLLQHELCLKELGISVFIAGIVKNAESNESSVIIRAYVWVAAKNVSELKKRLPFFLLKNDLSNITVNSLIFLDR